MSVNDGYAVIDAGALQSIYDRLDALEGQPTPAGDSYAANYLTVDAQGRVNPLIQFGGAAGGDLSGTYPNPTVATVEGGKTPVTTGNQLGLLIGSPMLVYVTTASSASYTSGATVQLLSLTGFTVSTGFDPESCRGGLNNVDYVCPNTGYYLLAAACSIQPSGAGSFSLSLGNRSSGQAMDLVGASPGGNICLSGAVLLSASAGQELSLEFQGTQNASFNTASLMNNPAIWMAACQVGS